MSLNALLSNLKVALYLPSFSVSATKTYWPFILQNLWKPYPADGFRFADWAKYNKRALKYLIPK